MAASASFESWSNSADSRVRKDQPSSFRNPDLDYINLMGGRDADGTGSKNDRDGTRARSDRDRDSDGTGSRNDRGSNHLDFSQNDPLAGFDHGHFRVSDALPTSTEQGNLGGTTTASIRPDSTTGTTPASSGSDSTTGITTVSIRPDSTTGTTPASTGSDSTTGITTASTGSDSTTGITTASTGSDSATGITNASTGPDSTTGITTASIGPDSTTGTTTSGSDNLAGTNVTTGSTDNTGTAAATGSTNETGTTAATGSTASSGQIYLPAGVTQTFNSNFANGGLSQFAIEGTNGQNTYIASNGELERYSPNNVTVNSNGILQMNVTDNGNGTYGSGGITTLGSFAQDGGIFNMSAELPASGDTWPAFWLLPSNGSWPPEIDAMEALGNGQGDSGDYTPANGWIHIDTHYGSDNSSQGNWVQIKDANGNPINLTDTYNNYEVAWVPGQSLTYYVDGQQVGQYTGSQAVPDTPMYMVANDAVGGDWGGTGDTSAAVGQQMNIQSIQAWQTT
jgi:beta-glucanase (GH16 family)